jgi:hypothetical protein
VSGDGHVQISADRAVLDADAIAELHRRLDALPQHRAQITGQAVHVVSVPGRGPDPLALLLTHGWPGSLLEYLPVLDRLVDPVAHGSDLGAGVTA